MKQLLTSLYLTGKPLRSSGEWRDRYIATETFEDPGRIDPIWDPAPSRQGGVLGDDTDAGVPLIP